MVHLKQTSIYIGRDNLNIAILMNKMIQHLTYSKQIKDTLSQKTCLKCLPSKHCMTNFSYVCIEIKFTPPFCYYFGKKRMTKPRTIYGQSQADEK